MEYASKNIMLNVHSILRETVETIRKNSSLTTAIDLEEFKSSLAIKMDNILSNILLNLANSYPQAPASGGTPRMREVINEVNRVNDEENDLIFANGIKISDYLQIEENEYGEEQIIFQEDGDYT